MSILFFVILYIIIYLFSYSSVVLGRHVAVDGGVVHAAFVLNNFAGDAKLDLSDAEVILEEGDRVVYAVPLEPEAGSMFFSVGLDKSNTEANK